MVPADRDGGEDRAAILGPEGANHSMPLRGSQGDLARAAVGEVRNPPEVGDVGPLGLCGDDLGDLGQGRR